MFKYRPTRSELKYRIATLTEQNKLMADLLDTREEIGLTQCKWVMCKACKNAVTFTNGETYVYFLGCRLDAPCPSFEAKNQPLPSWAKNCE